MCLCKFDDIEHAVVLGFWNGSDINRKQYKANAETCGTPDFIRLVEETVAFTTVWKLIFWRYVLAVFRILAGKPQFIFSSSPSWRILPNVFSKSGDTMTALLKAVVRWSVIQKSCEVVEWPDGRHPEDGVHLGDR
ncbi:hypothetical protein Trydic_g13628 [Trypoxylus dichotomus]